MVAGFRARMVGRVAILDERLPPVRGLACRSDILCEAGPVAWVKERYPHLKLQRFGWTQRPELFRPQRQSVPSTPSTLRRNKKREVFAIEFEDDQQATDFKLRWV